MDERDCELYLNITKRRWQSIFLSIKLLRKDPWIFLIWKKKIEYHRKEKEKKKKFEYHKKGVARKVWIKSLKA